MPAPQMELDVPLARNRVENEQARWEEMRLECAWRVLMFARDIPDAMLMMDILGLGPPAEPDPFPELRRRQADRSWEEPDPEPVFDLESVKTMILNYARVAPDFSANTFYLALPDAAHPLIGPAIQSLRRRHFEAAGTEIAVNPARKGSRVTVYRFRRD
jgi:hypothetical protein